MKKKKVLGLKFNTDGFTLIELLIVIVIIGVLFAIAAPNWVAFVNQQRVSNARNQVSQAIRSAQSQAKRTKVPQAIVFQNQTGGAPRYAIIPRPNDSAAIDRSKITTWATLGDGAALRLSVNCGVTASNCGTLASPPPLMFDAYGSIVSSSSEPAELPYAVTIGTNRSANPRRCVTVTTLLGGMIEGSNNDATPNTPCPANRTS